MESSSNSKLISYGSQTGWRTLEADILFNSSIATRSNQEHSNTPQCTLISLCAAVQALELDFLPITWQPHTGLSGSGGTSTIRQSSLGLDLSLAFKTLGFDNLGRERSAEESRKLYSVFLSELRPMGHSAILKCPFIQLVEGICWSLDPTTDIIDPVLVYERAGHGDLSQYLTSDNGKTLELYDRLRLCRDIAIGLSTLHECGIVHGDVKPQNVLILEADLMYTTPKLCDFGYSTTFQDGMEDISVARTVPWNAPEVQQRLSGLSPNEAKKTDVYSFGMLVLWVVFRQGLAAEFGLDQYFADERHAEAEIHSSFEAIIRLKSDDKIRPVCRQLVSALPLSPYQKQNLAEVFDIALCASSADRGDSMQHIRQLLDESLPDRCGFPKNLIPKNVPSPSHGHLAGHTNFKLSESIFQLIRCDFRVRKYLTQCLREEAQQVPCVSNSAFQLSLCYLIGFGVAADKEVSRFWLQASGKSEDDLATERDAIAHYSQADWPYLYHTTFLNNLHNDGYLRSFDYLDTHMPKVSIHTLRESYERELIDLRSELGETAYVTLALSQVYGKILGDAGHYPEAIRIGEQQLAILTNMAEFDAEHMNIQNTQSDLADLYRHQGNYQEASRYGAIVKEARAKTFGPDHPLMMTCLHLEANLLKAQGLVPEAEAAFKSLVEQRKKLFGNNHAATVNALSDLGTLYSDYERFEEAAEIIEEERMIREECLGPSHHSTLATLCDLANVYIQQEDFERAQYLLERALFGLSSSLGKDHLLASVVHAGFGALYLKTGDYDKSLESYDTALDHIGRQLGPNHPVLSRIRLSKANLLQEMQADFDEIESLYRECLISQEENMGDDHPDVLVTLSEYGSFLLDREHFEEAETLHRILIRRQESRLGAHHGARVVSLQRLGQALEKLERKDAEDTYREALDLAATCGLVDTPIGWECMEALGEYLHQSGHNLDEAETLFKRVIESRDDPMDNYATLHLLGELYIDVCRFEDAISILEMMRDAAETFEADYDQDKAELSAKLAWTFEKAGRHPDAKTAYKQAIAHAVNAFGEVGEKVFKLRACLADCLDRLGKHGPALSVVLRALHGCKDAFGYSHPVYFQVASRAAGIQFRQGRRLEAIALSAEVLEGCQQLYGAQSKEAQAAQANHALYTSTI
ncbi:hypothetical protein NX059_009179 [Plenodomus lindquistii]|nr:hypothetical protein NX059_009179 [Plenodomus lindquistii]